MNNSPRKKGFVFIPGSEIPLRFLHAGAAFHKLEERHEIVYVPMRQDNSSKDPCLEEVVRKLDGKVRWINNHPSRTRKWRELFDVSCIIYRDRSPSFAVRHDEFHKMKNEGYDRLIALAQPNVFEKYKLKVNKEQGLNPDILSLALREQPDYFVLPSSLLDRLTDDVLQLAEKLNIPVLLLTSGWDNLSSKGLLQRQPTMLGVWGEQTKLHAITVQNIDEDRIEIMGAPHYGSYSQTNSADKSSARVSLGLPDDGRKLALFAGTLRLFDETETLKEIDRAIENGELPKTYVLYRPHPDRVQREKEKSFFDFTWKHVVMDPEMAEHYKAHKKGVRIVPANFLNRIDYLTELYKALDVVITPMSSILLESIIHGIPVMAVAFSDGKHSWSADKVSRMLHFKEMYEISDIILCRDRSMFITDIKYLLSQVGDQKVSDALCRSSTYFVYQEDRPYRERVLQAVEKMMLNVNTPPLYNNPALRFNLFLSDLKKMFRVYATLDLPLRIARRMRRIFTPTVRDK